MNIESLIDRLQEADELGPDSELPFFVYGTLRPGCYNAARTWKGRASHLRDGAVHLPDYRLVGRGFPYAIPAPGEWTVGALIVPHRERYVEVRRTFDALEGYPRHYDRVKVTVHLVPRQDSPGLPAWLYTPPARRLGELEGAPPVPANDWKALEVRR